jgi:Methyltransferase domain
MGAKDLLFKTFRTIDRAGMHALPKHYYSPVPDCSWLEDNRPLWIGRSSLTGIAWDLPAQMAWLKDVCESYYPEVAGLESYRALARNGSGPGFSEIEAQVLHCFIRRFAPERVIEIGSGVSTLCMLEAARLNHRDGKASSQITCVEPYPSDRLKNSNEIELIPEFCQKVPLDLFDQLSSGDLLFIDCSHAVKIGNHSSPGPGHLYPYTRYLLALRIPSYCVHQALVVAGDGHADGTADQQSKAPSDVMHVGTALRLPGAAAGTIDGLLSCAKR